LSAPASSAFISYSRDDSEFALRLAKDLKAAGASVWLDQLDIPFGGNWDNAIEDALIAAQYMVLILSPASARSNNVRDEVSYALEQGKIVIPVLYQDCTVPLRLQRKQRIDFRADYTRGLTALLEHLRVPTPNQAVLDQAAEAEARRHAAWRAREVEAEKRRSDSTPHQSMSQGSPGKANRTQGSEKPLEPIFTHLKIDALGYKAAQRLKSKIRSKFVIIAIGLAICSGTVYGFVSYEFPSRKAIEDQAMEMESKYGRAHAAALLSRACRADTPETCDAALDIAIEYKIEGNGTRELAVLKKLCDVHNAHQGASCRLAGDLYADAGSTLHDAPMAAASYESACEHLEEEACFKLADSYYYGNGVARDIEKSVSLYRKACDINPYIYSNIACAVLGVIYANGDGVAKDRGTAWNLFKKACPNDGYAECVFAVALQKGMTPITRDVTKIAAFLQGTCMTKDDFLSCGELAALYKQGAGVPKDDNKAIAFIQHAIHIAAAGCSAGDIDSCINMGNMFFVPSNFGRDGSPDPVAAKPYYQRACDSGVKSVCEYINANFH